MEYGTVASRYARAIFAYARKQGTTKQIAGYFTTLTKVMQTTPLLVETLNNPVLDVKTKEQLLQIAAGAGNNEEFTHIIRLILTNKRENFIQWIALHYEQVYKQESDVVDINLTTSAGLDKETIGLITGYMGKAFHKTILLHTEVDPSIIGGFVMEWDTYRYDSSLKKRLEQIRKQLIRSYDRTDKNRRNHLSP